MPRFEKLTGEFEIAIGEGLDEVVWRFERTPQIEREFTIADEPEPGQPRHATMLPLMIEAVRDWENVLDADGRPIVFSEDAFFEYVPAPMRRALLNEWMQRMRGGAPEKPGGVIGSEDESDARVEEEAPTDFDEPKTAGAEPVDESAGPGPPEPPRAQDSEPPPPDAPQAEEPSDLSDFDAAPAPAELQFRRARGEEDLASEAPPEPTPGVAPHGGAPADEVWPGDIDGEEPVADGAATEADAAQFDGTGVPLARPPSEVSSGEWTSDDTAMPRPPMAVPAPAEEVPLPHADQPTTDQPSAPAMPEAEDADSSVGSAREPLPEPEPPRGGDPTAMDSGAEAPAQAAPAGTDALPMDGHGLREPTDYTFGIDDGAGMVGSVLDDPDLDMDSRFADAFEVLHRRAHRAEMHEPLF